MELVAKLAASGWTCQVVCPETLVVPYTLGGPKVWWLKPEATRFKHAYLKALVLSDVHKKDVAPFKTNGHYESLISGRPQKKRSSKARGGLINSIQKLTAT